MSDTIDHIQILDSAEAVRRRPKMYIGSTGPMGVAHLAFTLVDEALARPALGQLHVVTRPTLGVSDDGTPPSPDELVSWQEQFTRPPQDPERHDSLSGLDYAVAFALASSVVITVDGAHRWQQLYAQGRPLTPPTQIGPPAGRGTSVLLTPDTAIFGDAALPVGVLRQRLEELAILHPALTLTLDGAQLPSHGGLQGYARWLAGGCVDRCVHRHEMSDGVDIEVAIAWQARPTSTPPLEHSWVNGLRAEGEHLDGLRDALRETTPEGRVAVLRVHLPYAEY